MTREAEEIEAQPERLISARALWSGFAISVLGLLIIGGCAAYIQNRNAAFARDAETVLAALDAEDYETLLARRSTYWMERESPESARLFFLTVRRVLGKTTLVTPRLVGLQTEYVDMRFNVQFERGQAEVRLIFSKLKSDRDEQGRPKLVSFSVTSDELAQALRCPACGQDHDRPAATCVNCGAPLPPLPNP